MKREIVAKGATLRQAFAEAALATLGMTIDRAAVTDSEVREVRAHGASLESLLVQWIEECRYVQEIEGFGCRAIDFIVFDIEPKAGAEPLRVHALLRGETDAGSAPEGATASISAQDVGIRRSEDGYEIRVVLET
jgi:SHS2 domain-containing protein